MPIHVLNVENKYYTQHTQGIMWLSPSPSFNSPVARQSEGMSEI